MIVPSSRGRTCQRRRPRSCRGSPRAPLWPPSRASVTAFGPSENAGEIDVAGRVRRGRRPPSRSPRSPTPSPPRVRDQIASIVLAAGRRGESRADAPVSAAPPARAPPQAAHVRRALHQPPTLAIPLPSPGVPAAGHAALLRRQRRGPPRATRQFAFMGGRAGQDRPGIARPRVSAALNGPRRSSARSLVPGGPQAPCRASAAVAARDVVGNTEGSVVMEASPTFVGRRTASSPSTVALKLYEGVSSANSCARSLGGPPAPRRAQARRPSAARLPCAPSFAYRPPEPRARVLARAAQLGVVPHAASPRRLLLAGRSFSRRAGVHASTSSPDHGARAPRPVR